MISTCLELDKINPEAKNILEQYAIALSNPLSPKMHMAYTDRSLSTTIYQNNLQAFELIRSATKNPDRDNTSDICKFYDTYRVYINEILGSIGVPLIYQRSKMNTTPKGKELVRILCEDSIIIPDTTELLASRKGATNIIQVHINESGEYKCCVGFYEGEYSGNEKIKALENENNEVCMFDTINSAAQEVQRAYYRKLDHNSENKEGDGISAGEWKVYRSGNPNAEGKYIRDIIKLFYGTTTEL